MQINTDDYKFKIELHAHTMPVSPCGEVVSQELVKKYKELGFSCVVITNHFMPQTFENGKSAEENIEYYLSDFYEAKKAGDEAGLNIILGMEIRFRPNYNDYLVFGITEDDLFEAQKYVNTDIDTFYKEFKNDKNLIIQAHPFRNGMQPVNPKSLDGIEAFNMHPGHNSRVAMAARHGRENNFLLTAGTDFHHDGHEGLGAVMAKTVPKNSFEIADLIKSKDYIFNIGGCLVLPY